MFLHKPKYYCINSAMIQRYRERLNMCLNQNTVLDKVLASNTFVMDMITVYTIVSTQ